VYHFQNNSWAYGFLKPDMKSKFLFYFYKNHSHCTVWLGLMNTASVFHICGNKHDSRSWNTLKTWIRLDMWKPCHNKHWGRMGNSGLQPQWVLLRHLFLNTSECTLLPETDVGLEDTQFYLLKDHSAGKLWVDATSYKYTTKN
jgi:hypothetical protein